MINKVIRLIIPRDNLISMDELISTFQTAQLRILSHQAIHLDINTPTCRCIEITLDPSNEWTEMTSQTLTKTLGIDIFTQPTFSPTIKLAAFDMDSTVIKIEVIDELARAHGVYDQVSRITERVVGGEMSFKDGFRERMSLLKGLAQERLKDIADTIPYTPGADTLFQYLNKKGIQSLLISGGFNYFAKIVQQTLNINHIYANSLDIMDNVITGEVTSEIVGSQEKAYYFKESCKSLHIPLSDTLAVGDGANDIPMAKSAGISVGFRPKLSLKKVVDYAIEYVGLDGLIYLFE